MNALILFTFAAVAACVSASGTGTYVDGYGGAVIKRPSGSITSHEIPGTNSYGGVIAYSSGSYDAPIGHGIGIYGEAYGIIHAPGGYGGYIAIPTVVTGPQTHAVITGPQTNVVVTAPQTNAVVSGPRTHAVITGPMATAEIRRPQSYTVLVAPVTNGHEIINQGIGYGYGLGHTGVIGSGHRYAGAPGHGAILSNGDGYVSAGHRGAIVKESRTAPAVIDGPSGKVYSEGLWGLTTRAPHAYAHGW